MKLNKLEASISKFQNGAFSSASIKFNHPSGAEAGELTLYSIEDLYDLEYAVDYLKRQAGITNEF